MGRRSRRAAPLGVVLDTGQPDTLHRQISEQVRRAILERRLAPGARLPSSRLMAAELGCARGTVLTAIDHLIADGYLVARTASGVSVAADLPDEMLVAPAGHTARPAPAIAETALPHRTRALLAGGAGASPGTAGLPIAFPIGQPDREAFPFPLWAKLLEQEWRRPPWQIAGASHPFGHPGLRAAVATYLGAARGFNCGADTVVITSGVRQGVSLLGQVALEAGDEAWVEEPGYAGMAEALSAAGIRAVPVPIDASGFSTEAALAAAPGARMAVVAPAHQFPTGTVLSLQRRLALLSWAERRRGWIIEDDFDGEYRYAGRPLSPLRALDRTGRVAYLGSFSKLLFPALRLSYLVLPPSLVHATQAVMTRISVPAPLLGQGALACFIQEGHLLTHLRRTRLLYAKRQQALLRAVGHHLTGVLDVAPDGGGMHLVAVPQRDVAAGFEDVAASAAILAAGVQVSPLSVCYAGPKKAHGLLLGYAGTPEAEIDPAVAIIRQQLAE